jgi:hypothetical protein
MKKKLEKLTHDTKDLYVKMWTKQTIQITKKLITENNAWYMIS